jgi:hypothetical protein
VARCSQRAPGTSLIVYVGAFTVSWGWGFWLLNSELYRSNSAAAAPASS